MEHPLGVVRGAVGHAALVDGDLTRPLSCQQISGAKVVTYDAEAIAAAPADFKGDFTDVLTPAQVCVTLVRQQRGDFQNVSFMAVFSSFTTYEGVSVLGIDGHRQQTQTDAITP